MGSPEVALAAWLLLLDGGEVVRLELILRLGLALGLSDGGMLARLADLRELIGIVVPPEVAEGGDPMLVLDVFA